MERAPREQVTRAPAERAPAPAGAAPTLLRLQRSAGNRAVGRILARACEDGQTGPGASDVQEARDTVFRTALRAAMNGYAGVTIRLTNHNCEALAGYSMHGDPGASGAWTAEALHEDLTYALKWSFESPGEYTITLLRNAKDELYMQEWNPVRRMENDRTPGAASAKAASNVVYVIGSPSPGQAYPLQFVTAAVQGKQGEAVWFVERTGYEAAGVDLAKITAKAPGGRVRWVTPDDPLPGQLNKLPPGSVRHLVLYSHGLDGIATLRYGWGDKGKPDYGLDRADARKIDGHIFSETALIDLESCQGGTNMTGGSLAQVVADTTGHRTYGWTGRTSYADVNKGTGGVRGSEYTFSRDAVREWWVRNWVAEASPERKTFEPVR